MRPNHRSFPALRPWLQSCSVLGLLCLLAASYGLNLTKWTLFFNVDFIFGSIAVWLVVGLYGWRWGLLAGLLSGLCTYVLWNHPFSIITFTLEAGFVGWGFRRYHQNLLLLDGIFWCVLGMPLVWLFYHHFLNLDVVATQIVLLKQPVNALFNALVANLCLTHLPLHRWVGRPRLIMSLSLQQTLFNLFVAFVFFPTLCLTILSSQSVMPEIRSAAYATLNGTALFDVAEVQGWYEHRMQGLSKLAKMVARKTDWLAREIDSYLELTQEGLTDVTACAIANENGQILFVNAVESKEQLNALFAGPDNRVFWETAKLTQTPILSNPLISDTGEPYAILNIPIVRQGQVLGFVFGRLSLSRLADALQANAHEQTMVLTLVGRNQRVVLSTNRDRPLGSVFNPRADGDLHWFDDHTYQWFPSQGSHLMMVRWRNSRFIHESAIASDLPWQLVVEQTVQPEVVYVQRVYSRNLALILAIVLVALVCAVVLSRWLARPLTALAAMTTNLPDKLITGEPVHWSNNSRVTEVNSLVSNFRDMAAIVTQNFQEIQQALAYEALLKRITDHVRDSLDESQILRTAVEELRLGLGLIGCDAAIYSDDRSHATICYEHTTVGKSATGEVLELGTGFVGVHTQLLAGHCCQFSLTQAHPVREAYQRATVLACPMLDYHFPLGDVWLYKPVNTVFSESEVRLVQQVANQCAIAIRQARLYESAQIQVKALEELNYLKDDFLSTVSHELRTPLTNIKMAIKMLELSRTPEQRDRYLNILNIECQRESDLINDLLDLQRLTAGTQGLNLEPIHLRDWVADIVKTFEERTRHREQNLQVSISDELPVFVSDPACLTRIVSELLNNACKYTPPGEMIMLSARAIAELPPDPKTPEPKPPGTPITDTAWLALPRLEASLVLDVANTGVEIPLAEQAHIFEKFYRVPGIDRWKQGGTGLGLALVQKMAEHLGGSIRVQSQGNKTCFTVRLPIQPGESWPSGQAALN